MIEQVKKYLVQLQESICSDLESLDGRAIFEKDHWSKEDGNGSGITSVICDGNVFEKGGVNFSIVQGNKMPKSESTSSLISGSSDLVAVRITSDPLVRYFCENLTLL